ncbi:MAG: SDR family NAD(P)-dependent oxidoreductase [Acidimicrobiales bacterium]
MSHPASVAGPLDHRVAVVTGGGRGIGRALASAMAAAGAAVVVSSRTATELDEVTSTIEAQGGRAVGVVADATERTSAILPVETALDTFGRIDILVNNVGGTAPGSQDPFEGDMDAIEAVLTLNLTSAFWITHAALPHMRDQGYGRVISIGSGASRRAASSWAYTTAKHGLVGFTTQLAKITGPHAITANCLCPGWTNTSLIDFEKLARARGTTVEQARAAAAGDSAQGRILEPEELGPLAVLLASPAGGAITGQVIGVDGGFQL